LKKALIIVILILIVDQVFKIWIKTTMTLGQDIPVLGNWFILHFTENEGMAFGLSFGGETGKLILSIFRIIAAIAIGYYIWHISKRGASTGLVVCFALILAGALGNIIDSAFYGIIFSQSSYHTPAVIFPEGGGYSSFLHGKVVDMLYFPVIDTTWPEWVPIFGGQPFQFFRPVFNIADSAITTGVLSLIIFQRRFFTRKEQEAGEPPESGNDGNNDPTSS
jgi:signal peptidase II